MSFKNSSYRSGSVSTVPERETMPPKVEVRSGSLDGMHQEETKLMTVEPDVRLIVRHGKLEVVKK